MRISTPPISKGMIFECPSSCISANTTAIVLWALDNSSVVRSVVFCSSIVNDLMFSSAKISIIPDYAKFFRKKLAAGNGRQLLATKCPSECRNFAIANSGMSPLTGRNAFYDLSGRHLRPEAIIPYQGRKLSARVVTTIGTTRRDYRHDSKVRDCPCFDAVKAYADIQPE